MSNQELTRVVEENLRNALSAIDKMIWRGCGMEVKLLYLDLLDIKHKLAQIDA